MMENNIVVYISIADEINEEHELFIGSMYGAVEHAIHAGELLIQEKSQHKHGEWLNWVETNCKFDQSTARRYMQCANNKDKLLSNRARVHGLRDAMKLLAGSNIHVSDDSYEWFTPAEYVEAAKQVMGNIDLDPASSDEANKIIKASRFYTIEDDGLTQPWFGNVFLNPPYNMPYVEKFVDRAVDEYENGNIECAIVLINNATDTKWFHRLLNYPLCLVKGRIRFLSDDGVELATRQGQAFFYLGSGIDKFANEFGRFGVVLLKYDHQ
jgi:phage N-6-adenine-methyltransferase